MNRKCRIPTKLDTRNHGGALLASKRVNSIINQAIIARPVPLFYAEGTKLICHVQSCFSPARSTPRYS